MQDVTCGVASIAAAMFVVVTFTRSSKLDAIPTVGSSSWFGSWWAGFKFLTNGVDAIQEGYDKHKPAAFKVAEKYDWIVILSNREHIEELRSVPNHELSSVESTRYRLQARYLFGLNEILDAPYHRVVIGSQFTRNIGIMYPEIRDEIKTAFDEILDLRGNEWKDVLALSVIQKVVCRTSNRVFVGLPLCHNPDWINLNIQYAQGIVKTGLILGLLPEFIRPLAACFFTAVARDTMCGVKLLTPIIEERLKRLSECGNNWAEKPNDLLSWLIEEAKGPQLTVQSLATRVLFVNFISIHTTSASFTHALLYLAANPQYIQPLRAEVEPIIEKEGWSKAALGKMHKVDSFLRECQRMEGLGALNMTRKALKDFWFSDGTFIPKGTMLGVAIGGIHHDEDFYKNADVFEPFRFAEMHEEDDGEGGKYQFVSTSTEYQPFGHGKQGCPGRFFAASEMKSMFAHVVTTYDVKLEDGATRPRSSYLGHMIFPDARAKVLFRRRVD